VAFRLGDDRLQEHRVLVLDERHQVYVVLALDDEDALVGRSVMAWLGGGHRRALGTLVRLLAPRAGQAGERLG
jgi:hypothetical protein